MENKVELTAEMIEDAKKCSGKLCSECHMDNEGSQNCTPIFAAALQAELAKPNDDVWKDAPDDAIEGHLVFFRALGVKTGTMKVFIRELPKSRIDLIAEETARIFWMQGIKGEDGLAATIKAAILEAMEEGK